MTEVRVLKPHVSLNVKSVEASIEFYRKMFGIEPAKVRKGYAKFDVANPPLNFALNETGEAPHGALSHLGLQVATSDEVTAVRNRWREAGLLTREETQTTCCFAVQDKAWVADPDGNAWEVFVVLEDNLPEKAEASSCCVAPEPVSLSR